MDEFDVEWASHEEAQAIIDWAVPAAAFIHIMDDLDHLSPMERLEALEEGIQTMHDNMPLLLSRQGERMAIEKLNAVIEAEEAVEKFREELDEL